MPVLIELSVGCNLDMRLRSGHTDVAEFTGL